MLKMRLHITYNIWMWMWPGHWSYRRWNAHATNSSICTLWCNNLCMMWARMSNRTYRDKVNQQESDGATSDNLCCLWPPCANNSETEVFVACMLSPSYSSSCTVLSLGWILFVFGLQWKLNMECHTGLTTGIVVWEIINYGNVSPLDDCPN